MVHTTMTWEEGGGGGTPVVPTLVKLAEPKKKHSKYQVTGIKMYEGVNHMIMRLLTRLSPIGSFMELFLCSA